ncbi:hypothetical protein COO91_09490 (plasmid) [Nostoc flagelliforme CCNUN1]|uniref:Uncharacterized protein n=1 Tax=Nostoc flagelliforme CCNUN1 TaxID=2038116 RepID=A0A2K8T8A2_9NOSO|nr:hypothetical protein COO91_01979 [Nostoc flagelliforme CCNUN1]AUB43315.1 hypothetical protein COO91_09490 [Nostoc flagelliforme CCNUN1]
MVKSSWLNAIAIHSRGDRSKPEDKLFLGIIMIITMIVRG